MKQTSRPDSIRTALHWIVAIAMMGLCAMGFYMSKFQVWGWFELHKSLGLLATTAVLARLYWRFRHTWAPSSSGSTHTQGLAKLVRRLLLVITLAMPVTGMLYSGISGHGFGVFGLRLLPANVMPERPHEAISYHPGLEELAHSAHAYIAYLMLACLLLHICGALWHKLGLDGVSKGVSMPLGERQLP